MLLKESGEMYLETVYILLQERGAVRSVDVAKRMGFSGASVCRAMRILQDGGYLRQDKNKRLLLTEAGEARARKLYERHELLISFLTAIGVSEAAASADACKLEHYMSEETFRAIRRSCRKNNIAIYDMYGLDAQLLHYQACITGTPDLNSALKRCLPYDIISFEVIGTVFPETAEEVKAPYDLFTGLIPALRAKGKEIRFSLRRSFSEEKQIRALKESGFLPDERELIRRSGEDLSFRTLKESEPGKKILYFGSTMGNEFILPRYYGIDSILLEKYGIYPTYHARLVYLMMRRALAGDRTMLFALFSISSYDELVPQILYTSSKVINV